MTFLKQIAGMAALGAALLTGPILSPAQAGYVVTFKEVGSDVVATGSGPLDLTNLLPSTPNFASAGIAPNVGSLVTGPAIPNLDSVSVWQGFAQQSQFGNGTSIPADSGSGDMVGLSEQVQNGNIILPNITVIVPSGYVSDNPLSDTSTYLNQTFSSMGVTPGTYVWSWGDGQNQNFTLIIGSSGSPISEPAGATLLGTALAGLLLVGTIRRRQSEA